MSILVPYPSPYTAPQLMAGSLKILLEDQLRRQPESGTKLFYIIYGFSNTFYKQCWDLMSNESGNQIDFVSTEPLPETSDEEYPSGNHTVVHFRNYAEKSVVCFENGDFEGYGTSLGKLARIGNQVGTELAASLLKWIAQEATKSNDPKKNEIAQFLGNKTNYRILQFVFEIVHPRLDSVVEYLNAVYSAEKLGLEIWGKQLAQLGLFCDSNLFKGKESESTARTRIQENYSFSQIGYWQRESQERIRRVVNPVEVANQLVEVLSDAEKLMQVRSKVELEKLRPLRTKNRRSAEEISLNLILRDLKTIPSDHIIKYLENVETPNHEKIAQLIFDSHNPNQNYIADNQDVDQSETLQKLIERLQPDTRKAIRKAFTQQATIRSSNLFLGILKCLLLWKEEQIAQNQHTKNSKKVPKLPEITKLKVKGIEVWPDKSGLGWINLTRKVDLEIRTSWKDLLKQLAVHENISVENQKLRGKVTKDKSNNNNVAGSRPRGFQLSQVSLWTDVGNLDGSSQEEEMALEQQIDLEESETIPNSLDIDLEIEPANEQKGSKNTRYSFELVYDPLEMFMLQKILSSPVTALDREDTVRASNGQNGHTQNRENVQKYGALAWECFSESVLSLNLRGTCTAIVKGAASLVGTVPHSELPELMELYQEFEKVTAQMYHQSQGLGYFSTLLLPDIQPLLKAYEALLLKSRLAGQDEFQQFFGQWISQLFTIELRHHSFTHLLTPFHPLQLRWRHYLEQFLLSRVKKICHEPSTINDDLIEDFEALSPINVVGLLLSKASALPQTNLPHMEAKRWNYIAYPGPISTTGLLVAYSTQLQGLQTIPVQLKRKIEKFFRVYPASIDRTHISLITPAELEIENSMSQLFENLDQNYLGAAGFFVRIISAEAAAQNTNNLVRKQKLRYDEEQGELRSRSRDSLFPRTEFITLPQSLLTKDQGLNFIFPKLQNELPNQHIFVLLDRLGVKLEHYELQEEGRANIEKLENSYQRFLSSTLVDTSWITYHDDAIGSKAELDPVTLLMGYGQESLQYQVWSRELVSNQDTLALLYYLAAARSEQASNNQIYRYACRLAQSQHGEFTTSKLIKKLHDYGIWVAIVDRAISREFFRTSDLANDHDLILIDFHKGIGPQHEYNLTVSSIWTEQIKQNIQLALRDIPRPIGAEKAYLDDPYLALRVMIELQNISGGLALQLAATNASPKGLLGLLITSLEAIGYFSLPTSSEVRKKRGETAEVPLGLGEYRVLIPLDDHNEWFERDEVRTDLMLINFVEDSTSKELQLYFCLIESKYDDNPERAINKGCFQLKETARRLKERFSEKSPDFPFRLRDLMEAIDGLSSRYRGNLPEQYAERLRNGVNLKLHLEEALISQYLCLYQNENHLDEVQQICQRQNFELEENNLPYFKNSKRLGQTEKVVFYQYGDGLGQTFSHMAKKLLS